MKCAGAAGLRRCQAMPPQQSQRSFPSPFPQRDHHIAPTTTKGTAHHDYLHPIDPHTDAHRNRDPRTRRPIAQQRPIPTPGKGQALVQMLATGVSFAEQQMRRGRYPDQPKFPFVLGYDLVGVVTAVGPDVDTSLVGHRVAAVVKTGGWTTHAVVDARRLVPIPNDIDAADAETVVVNGITARQMMNKAKVTSGQTILI